MISISMGQESGTAQLGPLLHNVSQAAVKVLLVLRPHLKAQPGKGPFQAHSLVVGSIQFLLGCGLQSLSSWSCGPPQCDNVLHRSQQESLLATRTGTFYEFICNKLQ